MQSTITSKGQATIPKEVRDRLGLKPGDTVNFLIDSSGRIVLEGSLPASALRGILKGRVRKPVTIEQMREAVHAKAAQLDRLSRK